MQYTPDPAAYTPEEIEDEGPIDTQDLISESSWWEQYAPGDWLVLEYLDGEPEPFGEAQVIGFSRTEGGRTMFVQRGDQHYIAMTCGVPCLIYPAGRA